MPYEDRQLNIFKMITLWQIFYIFLIALVSFAEIYDKSDWRFEAVIYVVVFGNIPLEFIIGYIIPRFNIDKREQKLLFRQSSIDGPDIEL